MNQLSKSKKLLIALVAAASLLSRGDTIQKNLYIMRYADGKTEEFRSVENPEYYGKKFDKNIKNAYYGIDGDAEFFVNFNSQDVSDKELRAVSRKPLQEETVYSLISKYNNAYGNPSLEGLMKGIATGEKATEEGPFNPNASRDCSSATGIFQITRGTGKWVSEECFGEKIEKKDLFSLFKNIKIGCAHIKNIYNKHKNIHKTILEWNTGSSNVETAETRYIEKIVNKYI